MRLALTIAATLATGCAGAASPPPPPRPQNVVIETEVGAEEAVAPPAYPLKIAASRLERSDEGLRLPPDWVERLKGSACVLEESWETTVGGVSRTRRMTLPLRIDAQSRERFLRDELGRDVTLEREGATLRLRSRETIDIDAVVAAAVAQLPTQTRSWIEAANRYLAGDLLGIGYLVSSDGYERVQIERGASLADAVAGLNTTTLDRMRSHFEGHDGDWTVTVEKMDAQSPRRGVRIRAFRDGREELETRACGMYLPDDELGDDDFEDDDDDMSTDDF